MVRDFDWDDDNVEHIARHQVLLEEVEEALADPERITRPAHRSSEPRFGFLGATEAGRLLFVVVTPRRGLIRVVMARDADRTEKALYRRRRRRR